jgi:hypothetical protein
MADVFAVLAKDHDEVKGPRWQRPTKHVTRRPPGAATEKGKFCPPYDLVIPLLAGR